MRALLVVGVAGSAAAQQERTADTPLTRFAEQKAEALLRDKLPCLGCHQFGGDGGRLAPDLATVRSRRSAEYIAAIVRDPQRVMPGTSMPRHPMPASQEELIVRYLATRAGAATGDSAAAIVSAVPEDRTAPALYTRFCAGCHGATGGGDGPNAKFLPVPPAAHRSSAANRSPRMPAFALALQPAEIQSLVRHIRGLCRCEGPAWSTDGRRP